MYHQTTQTKIERLGRLYKAVVKAINNSRCDEHAIVQDFDFEVGELEELLEFARSITTEFDKPMARLINGIRGTLENMVHTEAEL